MQFLAYECLPAVAAYLADPRDALDGAPRIADGPLGQSGQNIRSRKILTPL